jgi:hypothetical protein
MGLARERVGNAEVGQIVHRLPLQRSTNVTVGASLLM